ncbi:amidohydrolase family protein [Pollutibacter soli]|uniref:amidohydrolase family protein n=1 Tax=Pollutibacter soli TaxID=3034157 RepID=UPI0030140CFC
MTSRIFALVSLICLFGCKSKEKPSKNPVIVFTGATIIDGSGGEPVKDAVMVVSGGMVLAVGSKDDVEIPENAEQINLSGKTIIPGIINGHGHVGDVKGIEGGHYSAENVVDNLSIYARYGITTVVSLGNDKKEAEAFRSIKDSLPADRSRLFVAGAIINGKTVQEAFAVIDSNAKMGVDIIKIRIDDQLGTGTKMPEEIYRDVITRSHELGYKVASHMYYLEDAKKLTEAGTDLLAHSVRDLPVDSLLIKEVKERGVGYCPTLTREISTFIYEDTPSFFSDPFFRMEYDSAIIKPLLDPAKQDAMKKNVAGQTYKKQLPVAMANLKTMQDNNIAIVFGTDSGVPTRFIGYFEHVEMDMMQQAGLTPMQIIVSATKNAAEKLGLKNLGTLSAGHWADFLILNADPLTDIKNVKQIDAVYIGGKKVNRK